MPRCGDIKAEFAPMNMSSSIMELKTQDMQDKKDVQYGRLSCREQVAGNAGRIDRHHDSIREGAEAAY